MEHHKASEIRTLENEFFQTFITTGKCQVASMRLLPDQSSGEFGTDHPDADQVCFVLEGNGHAKVEERTVELEQGDVLLIGAGERHQFVADGASSLRTLNVYAPVAYRED